MKNESKQFFDILIRYMILIIVALPNLWLFYFILTPLTIYPIYFSLSLFFETSLNQTLITIQNCFEIEIINACIAGAAYYFLLILNLSVPKIKLKKRVKMILLSFAALLILNILRIALLSFMFVSGSQLLDITHKLFWYLISTVFVVGIWFAEVKLFKIKEIPFYSDVKFLLKKSKLTQ